jgi:hypothetical protein
MNAWHCSGVFHISPIIVELHPTQAFTFFLAHLLVGSTWMLSGYGTHFLFSYCLECTKMFCIAWVFWHCNYTTWILLWDIWPNFSRHLDSSTISWEGVAWSKHYSAKLKHVYGVSIQTILSFWVKCHEKPHVSAANTHIYVRIVLEVVTMSKMCEPTTFGFCFTLRGVGICC